MSRRIVGLLITLVLAAGGGALAWWLATSGITPDLPVTERARAAAAGLGDDGHVYVDPSATGTFTDADLARLDAAAAASDPQAFLVVWPASREAGYGSPSDVLHQIGDLTGRPGLYVQVVPGADLFDTDVGIAGEYLSIYSAVGDEAETETPALLRLIDENDGREYEVGEDTSSNYWGGTGGMIAAGLTIGGLGGVGAGLLGLAGWALVRRRRAAA
ncbi:hypothetical protein [Jiangella endophytica]|uniref:hypothetical protein n=1 Tax=Jiangella endophytica TaxID=1623398 RepID=UPI000E352407|nr:hypothetical protein [Jiangella endophytica]